MLRCFFVLFSYIILLYWFLKFLDITIPFSFRDKREKPPGGRRTMKIECTNTKNDTFFAFSTLTIS